MTDRNAIDSIVTKLEARLAARVVDQIRPLLAGRSPEVQRAVLAALAAEFTGTAHPTEQP